MSLQSAVITCETGEQFQCLASSAVEVGAELVFNTALCGYQEIVTDPSYAGQAVVFTTAHVGNTGINSLDNESDTVQVKAAIINTEITPMSNWRAEHAFAAWLADQGIPVLFQCDTRALTLRLRTAGSVRAWITTKTDTPVATLQQKAHAVPSLEGQDLALQASCTESYIWSAGMVDIANHHTPHKAHSHNKKVIVYDFGIKRTILRLLVHYGAEVEVVPANTPSEQVLAKNPDGVLLSNGPGDPSACDYAITAVQSLLRVGMPLFGICLGYQIMCLALGAKTVKMPFGHHGANHPVQDLTTKRVYITSQNHGFMVDKSTIDDRHISHLSLFDNSVQGIVILDKKIIAFQGHPEASPGPSDIQHQLFSRFFSFM